MNLKLDELRKLLLQPEPPMIRVQERRSVSPFPAIRQSDSGAETNGGTGRVEPSDPAPERGAAVANSLTSEVLNYVSNATQETGSEAKSQYQLAAAVAKVFEPTRTFQESLARLSKAFEQVDILGQSASRALAPMKAFAEQVAQIAQNFGPMKAFQEQLAQIGQAFHDHLIELSRTLEPAKKLQAKAAELARGLDSVSEMQAEFDRLAETFKVSADSASSATSASSPASYANGAATAP